MYELVIRMPDRPETVGRLVPGRYRIGSSPAAHIQISRDEVSSRHAVLIVDPDSVAIEDAGSTNGTFVDGKRVRGGPVPVESGATIAIGHATLELRRLGSRAAPVADRAAEGESPVASTQARALAVPADESPSLLRISGIPYEYRKVVQTFKQRVHEELLKRINLRNLTLSGADPEEVRRQARETIGSVLNESRAGLPSGIDVRVLEEELLNEAVGLGPLEVLLQDEAVTEIMVNGAGSIYVEKAGKLFRTDLMFADDSQLLTAIERIVAPLGRRVDESQPLVDARLPDGSRVNAIIPPLAIDGPSLTIRKFAKEVMTAERLVGMGSLSQEMSEFLLVAVRIRKNILVSGGTGTGKTTLLNTLGNFLPNEERIVTIEDAAELRLRKEHVVRLESRPPNIEGRGSIAIRDLVRNALRMRPDRIVVGECRGGEALDMLQAMNTGHDGSLTTIHANSPRDALARLETLVLMAGFDLPLRAIREQVASAISLIVQIGRFRDGTRKVEEISEVTGMEGDVITSQELFLFKNEGLSEDGRVRGHHTGCGIVPTFIEEVTAAGIPFDLGLFNET